MQNCHHDTEKYIQVLLTSINVAAIIVMFITINSIYYHENQMQQIAVTKETLFAMRTVQIDLDFKGKYKAMNFSIDNIMSKAEE